MRRFILRAVRNAAVGPVLRRQYQPVNIAVLQQRFASTAVSTSTSTDKEMPSVSTTRTSTVNHHTNMRSYINDGKAREACNAYDQLRKSKKLSVLTADDLQGLIQLVHSAVKDAKTAQGLKSFMAVCAESAYQQLFSLNPTAAKTQTLIFSLLRICSVARHSSAVKALIKQINEGDFPCNRDDYISLIQSCININSLTDALTIFDKMSALNRPNVRMFDLYLELCERASRKILSRMTSQEELEALRSAIDFQKLASMEEMFEAEIKRNGGSAPRRFDQMLLIYAVSGKLDKAQQLLTSLISVRNQPPKLSTYGGLVSAYSLNGREDLALQAFEEAERYYGAEKLSEMGFSLLSMIRVFLNAGEVEKSMQVVDWILKSTGDDIRMLHGNLPVIIGELSGGSQSDSNEIVQQKVQELQTKLTSISEDQDKMKLINSRNFDFQAASGKLRDAVVAQDLEASIQAFEKFASSGRYPDMELSDKLCSLLVSKKRDDALGRMIRANQKLPPFSLSKAYLETLLANNKLADAWVFYRETFRDKAKYTLPTIGNYSKMIQALANGQKMEWASQLLTDLEGAAKERAPKFPVWSPPFQSPVYTYVMQGYTRTGQSAKALEVFDRMSASDNPLQIPPTIHTYNTLLMAFIRDWNMVAVNELCDALAANSGRQDTLSAAASSNDRQATRELTKQRWEEFQRERSTSTVKIPVPSYISPNRITENLRLLALVNSNQLDQISDAYAKSLTLPEPPSMVTFEVLASYQLRRMGRVDFALKSLQRPIAKRCLDVLKGEKLELLSADSTLATVETCAKEFLQDLQQQDSTAAAEPIQQS